MCRPHLGMTDDMLADITAKAGRRRCLHKKVVIWHLHPLLPVQMAVWRQKQIFSFYILAMVLEVLFYSREVCSIDGSNHTVCSYHRLRLLHHPGQLRFLGSQLALCHLQAHQSIVANF